MRRGVWGFGFGPEGFWGVHRGRAGRGRQQWFEAGDMKYVILKLLRDKPMHGYDVMKALEEETSGCYKPSPGTVYPTLQWLADEGLVQADDVGGKKVYAITDEGRAFLDEHKGTVEDIFDRVAEGIDRWIREPMPEVNRAVGRVVRQVYQTAWKASGNDEKVRKIAEILERAGKELEAI